MDDVTNLHTIRLLAVNIEATRFGTIRALIPNNAFIEISLKGIQKIESSPPITLTHNKDKNIYKNMIMYI
jgi:hypothetical protein